MTQKRQRHADSLFQGISKISIVLYFEISLVSLTMTEDTHRAMICDCYVHKSTRFINKIVGNAAAKKSSHCPL